MREQAADSGSAFPGHGVLKPEQKEIERLRREPGRMKAERDILKSGGLLRQGFDMRFEFIAKHHPVQSLPVPNRPSGSRLQSGALPRLFRKIIVVAGP